MNERSLNKLMSIEKEKKNNEKEHKRKREKKTSEVCTRIHGENGNRKRNIGIEKCTRRSFIFYLNLIVIHC